MDVEILIVGRDDAALLGDCDPDVFDREIDPKRLTAYLADPGHRMVIARAGGKVIAQARGVIHHQPDETPHLYLDNLGVAEDWRRQGIAGRLLGALEAWGRELGCAEAWVLTEPDNAPARALYATRGGRHQVTAYYTYDL